MQRNRFESYRGQILFLREYRLRAVQGESINFRKVTRGLLAVILLTMFNTEHTFLYYFAHISIKYN